MSPAPLQEGLISAQRDMGIFREGQIRRIAWNSARAIYEEAPTPADRAAKMEADRFRVFEMLLTPLEEVREDTLLHPEGDVLYHSLQTFDLARDLRPFDEEFLLAALLHDVGKGLDALDHVAAGVEILEGFVTPRTLWLVEHHGEALALRRGTLGARARWRLEASEDFEELTLLAECDEAGRKRGVPATSLQGAVAYLRELAAECGGD